MRVIAALAWRTRGNGTEDVVDVLRTATGPMTTADMGVAILAKEVIEAGPDDGAPLAKISAMPKAPAR